MHRLLALALLLLGTTFSLPASAQNLTSAQVEAIVARYIEKNGDKLIDSITAYNQRQQMSAAMGAVRYYNPARGPASAKVTVIEFTDFECPFCARVQPTILEMRKRYGDRVRWVAKHMPLDFHAKARPASYAAQAAHIQGKYWEFADRLWLRQEFLGDALYQEIAKDIGLDVAKFNTDRASPGVKAAVDADMKDAAQVGARGTPFFLINGVAVSGAQPPEVFVQAIEAGLNGKTTATK